MKVFQAKNISFLFRITIGIKEQAIENRLPQKRFFGPLPHPSKIGIFGEKRSNFYKKILSTFLLHMLPWLSTKHTNFDFSYSHSGLD